MKFEEIFVHLGMAFSREGIFKLGVGKGDFLVVARNFVGIGHREERGGKCPIPTNRTETGRIFSKYGHLMTA